MTTGSQENRRSAHSLIQAEPQRLFPRSLQIWILLWKLQKVFKKLLSKVVSPRPFEKLLIKRFDLRQAMVHFNRSDWRPVTSKGPFQPKIKLRERRPKRNM